MKYDFLKTALKQQKENREKDVMYGTEVILILVIVVLLIIILWQKTIKIIIAWKIIKFILECLLSAVTEMEENKKVS